MPYPGRPVLEPLPSSRATATIKQSAQQRRTLIAFVAREYRAGRSLRELAELTDRSQTAIRRAHDEVGVPRRGRGASPVNVERDNA
jgi:hypothetical protein